ncbi:MAG: hypothetical protein KBG20_08990 [Caldilineaceae bacterium]|nr:hypothetical protein [Caldilineaceae bacterium]MBP9072422.1 hypothetical protein [Caldilineaceae bacterium]
MPDFSQLSLPPLPAQWVLFAGWPDLFFGLVALGLVALLSIWWQQQTDWWVLISVLALGVAASLSMASLTVFQVPAHFVGCPDGCDGWQGYPLAFASVDFAGVRRMAPVDFVLNLLWTWVVTLFTFMMMRLLGMAYGWSERGKRARFFFLFFVFILPFSLLPRVMDPPQPYLTGETQRLAVNALRTAQYTYNITGAWTQRLAVEDIRSLSGSAATFGFETNTTQVCLRGYTYFYLPWRRYRIILDTSGVVALNLTELPLDQPCW